MSSAQTEKARVYTRYPSSTILLYQGVTILHFTLGGVGIILGYSSSWVGWALGLLYLVFAFVQMYIIMPLTVCPHCIYTRMEGARCTSGMNIVAKRIGRQGRPEDFPTRAQGLLCHNNLYLAALALPIVLMIPALILNFSTVLLALWLAVVGLLLLRFFVMLPRLVCVHCQAKTECPNARAMGLHES
jgi:hypothetical protein